MSWCGVTEDTEEENRCNQPKDDKLKPQTVHVPNNSLALSNKNFQK